MGFDPETCFRDMIGPEPVFDTVDEELNAEVIVVGGGIAGVSALRSSAEWGAKTLLFEKCSTIQGRSGAFGLIGFRDYNRFGCGTEEIKRKICAEIIKEGGNRGDYRIIRYWADHCAEDFEWYIQPMGDLYILKTTTDVPPEGVSYWLQSSRDPLPANYDPEREYYPSYPGVWQFRPGGHLPVLKKNYEAAVATGRVTSYFNTPVKTLLRQDGRITGVIAQGEDGKIYRATAEKGVILATGDYSGDEAMLNYYAPQSKYCPRIYGSRDRQGRKANTGDGHRMGVWAGGVLENPPHAVVSHHMGGPLGINAFLQLNAFGERFMNEDVGGMQLEHAIERLPGHYAWQFFDGAWPEHTPWYSILHGTVSHCFDKQDQREGKVNRTLNKMDGYTSVEDVEEEVAKGRLLKADTLEELIALTGLPFQTALTSIRRYNDLAARGDDADFGKKATRMFPLVKAPFYACKLTPAPLLVTVSGLCSDAGAHVLDANGKPIPGLYACGNVQGSRFGAEDPSMFPGTSHTIALTFGRLAGRSAATSQKIERANQQ